MEDRRTCLWTGFGKREPLKFFTISPHEVELRVDSSYPYIPGVTLHLHLKGSRPPSGDWISIPVSNKDPYPKKKLTFSCRSGFRYKLDSFDVDLSGR